MMKKALLRKLTQTARGDEFLRWLKEEYISRKVMYRPFQFYYMLFRPQPTFIADMTWDNLIVLDACRFDAFAQLNYIPGRLTKIISTASATWGWLRNNFSDRNMKDVVYISANPYASYYGFQKMFGRIPFYRIIEVWKDGWSEELKTVHPSAVNEAALDSLNSYPQKRHLIHYMQPHHPFIGDVKIVDEQPGGVMGAKILRADKEKKLGCTLYDMLQKGLVDATLVWRAYISNLQLVINYVKKLLPSLTGKTCITSDHGESFGRFGIFYGHPDKIALSELIEVPWLEVSRL